VQCSNHRHILYAYSSYAVYRLYNMYTIIVSNAPQYSITITRLYRLWMCNFSQNCASKAPYTTNDVHLNTYTLRCRYCKFITNTYSTRPRVEYNIYNRYGKGDKIDFSVRRTNLTGLYRSGIRKSRRTDGQGASVYIYSECSGRVCRQVTCTV